MISSNLGKIMDFNIFQLNCQDTIDSKIILRNAASLQHCGLNEVMRQHHQFRVNSHSHLHHGYQKLYRFLQLATIQLLNLHTSYIHTSTSIPSPAKTNMPPKGQKDSVATHAGASVTKNPTISKPPRSRPDASAAVQEAMARLA